MLNVFFRKDEEEQLNCEKWRTIILGKSQEYPTGYTNKEN
jgi:hypothetical protein